MITKLGKNVLWAVIAVAVVLAVLGIAVSAWWFIGLAIALPLVLIGVWDLTQTRHSVLRNFPIIGHLRFLIEDIGPEMHQYVVENGKDGRPFNRDTRSLIYQRSKGAVDKKPFGTELDVYAEGYTFLRHSVTTLPIDPDPSRTLRTTIGGLACKQPYSASVFNVSAMSFGALGRQAILALNAGAARGGFAHDTGEGGISRYHREHGGDLIWQIGTGYFGCRTESGGFDAAAFQRQAALDQVKMIEIKLSQGAKPGHGGILPAAKVTAEIAEARMVPAGRDVESPTHHSAFSTPLELMAFVARLRELSGGKPIGIKLCVGDPPEFMAIVKAMLQTGIVVDFVVVDGAEGGTGAAPLEFSDSLGMPLLEGLVIVHNALVGAGLRDDIRIGASGKIVTASAMAQVMAMGADWVNTARGFMFALGCIQAQRCHTNQCPTGVTTQDDRLQRALVVKDKAERVYRFHRSTLHAFAELLAAMGVPSPTYLLPHDVVRRVDQHRMLALSEIYPSLESGALLRGDAVERMQHWWDIAEAERFRAPRSDRYPAR